MKSSTWGGAEARMKMRASVFYSVEKRIGMV